jgi:hypothetical protein
MVLRLGTPAVPMKGPNSELREDINDKFSQFVDLKDGESEKCDPKQKDLRVGHSVFLSFQKMSSSSRMKLWSGLTSAVITALW